MMIRLSTKAVAETLRDPGKHLTTVEVWNALEYAIGPAVIADEYTVGLCMAKTCEQHGVRVQLANLARKEIARKAIDRFGAIVIAGSLLEAAEVSNSIAPEHLELAVEKPFELLAQIKNAGAIFLGHYTPESVGDYIAGPNHVLPTGGTARFFSPLSTDSFMKKSSLIFYTKEGLDKVGGAVMQIADVEGLDAHGNTIKVRMAKK